MSADPDLVARAILTGPAFRHTATPASPTIWERIGRWLSERWETIVSGIGDAVGRSPRTSAFIGIVVILALAALLVVLLVRLTLLATRTVSAPSQRRCVAFGEPAAQLAARARVAAEAGAFGDAVTLLYRAALRLLGERAILPEDPAATPGEIARAVPAVAPLAREFVIATYARRPIDAQAWNDAEAAYRGLETTERS